MRELQAALAAAVTGEVRFDAGARAAYASEASNYRQVPIGVVLPRSAEDVVRALAACREHAAPVLARGGGTSMCGQSVNVAVLFDFSKYMDRVLAVDAQARSALVEPGVVCDSLRAAAEAHGLTFGPDPATHSRCTLGGMIGNNSCGAHSVMAGKTVENIEALEVLTYDGARFWCGPTDDAEFQRILARNDRQAEIYRGLKVLADRYADLIRKGFPRIKRRVSGYNLDQLLPENGFNVARALVGSEGTCALTLQARATLVKSPPHRVLLVQGYPDVYQAGDAVPEILPTGPIACEGLDEPIIGGLRERGLKLEDLKLLPEGNAWLMIEYGGDTAEEAIAKARAELASDLSMAFLVVLERLSPDERAAFLLRDVFDCNYGEMARVLERSEAACRQLVHRARARVRQGEAAWTVEVRPGGAFRIPGLREGTVRLWRLEADRVVDLGEHPVPGRGVAIRVPPE